MIILGIETSCDETAASVVQDGTIILSNVVASSVDIHTKTGGIVPENAARLQVKSIIPVIQQALIEAFPNSQSTDCHTLLNKIDAVAVTSGPGLIGSLLVGVETAKTLSYLLNKPLVPINHLIAHIYANWLGTKEYINKITHEHYSKRNRLSTDNFPLPKFPAVALVVSGGHTDLVLMMGHGNIKWLGGTLDDAAGEAFDKCARLLGLSYPGGPAIANEAEKYLSTLPKVHLSSKPLANKKFPQLKLFPRPLINSNTLDFSFSGLKTSVFNYVKNQSSNFNRQKLSAEIQEAIIDSLIKKSLLSIKIFKPKSFLLAGGVSANKRLREKIRCGIGNMKGVAFHVALPHLCTDNSAPIASCAYFNYNPVSWKRITTNPQMAIVPNAVKIKISGH